MNYIEQQKTTLKRVIETLDSVEEVYFIYKDGDMIRRHYDMDYNGAGKEVLVVDYKPEYYAYSKSIINWEYIRPDEAKNLMEI